ncbi:CBO0543 family protein [Neobacillus vireti]|uniref:CBO0543 family protein n=1 Tax=Neobacillus vireti TaxID=220686 RepID=UPI003B58B0F7
MIYVHIVINLLTILAALRWGDWKNINKYYPTLLYLLVGNLLYFYLYDKDMLWDFTPDFSEKWDKIREIIYIFIAFPCSILLYLSNMPQTKTKKLLHIILWIVIYSCLELLWHHFGLVSYNRGWNFWWSLGFDCVMFPLLLLHNKRPYVTLIISLAFVLFLTSIFSPKW